MQKNKINGVVNIFKEKGKNSTFYTNFLKKKFLSKVGHIGTLDPMAFGVLPICLGEATKFIQYMNFSEKKYIFRIIFNYETDTLDSFGKIIANKEKKINREDLYRVLSYFKGSYEQSPTMYSARKYKGKALYKYARENISVDCSLRSKEVNIYDIELIHFSEEDMSAIIKTKCSSGTYIRSLASDIAHKLGTISYVDFLMRESSGPFYINESVDIYETEDERSVYEIDKLIPYDKLILKEDRYEKALNGMSSYVGIKEPLGLRRVYSRGKFVGIGEVVNTSDSYKSVVMKRVLKND